MHTIDALFQPTNTSKNIATEKNRKETRTIKATAHFPVLASFSFGAGSKKQCIKQEKQGKRGKWQDATNCTLICILHLRPKAVQRENSTLLFIFLISFDAAT